MISLSKKEFLEMPVEEFIIPAEKVAHVQLGNNVEHALLVLTKSGYSAIPFLWPNQCAHDYGFHLRFRAHRIR